MRSLVFSCSAFASQALAASLYVASQVGNITSLTLDVGADGKYSLSETSTAVCGGSRPNWLTLDSDTCVLYATCQASPNGSLVAYDILPGGELELFSEQETIVGPVHLEFYNNQSAVVLTHYDSSTVSTFSVSADGDFAPLQNFTYTGPLGPATDRQNVPHPHSAVLDQSGAFIVVPDLGSDLLRIYSIDPSTSILTPLTPFATKPGTGPRHAVFHKVCDQQLLYVLNELSQSVTSYTVTYGTGEGIVFTEIDTDNVYGGDKTIPQATAAEITVSPDGRFVLSSSRGDSLFNITSPENPTGPQIPSDTLQSFAIDEKSGALKLTQIAPSGGKGPRHFSINEKGNLVAVGLQADGRVVIVERNVKTGKYGSIVASLEVEGPVVAVVWGNGCD